MQNFDQKLRAKIRAARELMGYTQEELAKALGYSLTKISNAETGKTKSVNILNDIKSGMEHLGVVFTKNGVEFSETYIETIEGNDCYLKLLQLAFEALITSENKELLIAFSSDSVSPKEVNEQYRLMRKNGINMRQIIRNGDDYIMGNLNEYRSIPEEYFTNIVTLIFDTKVAQVSGDETRIIVHHDPLLAESERRKFSYFWDTGKKPKKSIADMRF